MLQEHLPHCGRQLKTALELFPFPVRETIRVGYPTAEVQVMTLGVRSLDSNLSCASQVSASSAAKWRVDSTLYIGLVERELAKRFLSTVTALCSHTGRGR